MKKHDFIEKGEVPIALFQEWLAQAEAKAAEMGDIFPNAMSVATADKKGRPSVRILLLKAVNENGFVFYTNTAAQKGRELSENPYAELCFYWPFLGRQVRVSGVVKLVSDTEADAYFQSRARESQIGAWASKQSTEIQSRDVLQERYEHYEAKFEGKPVPRPEYWSGYRLIPEKIEFWQIGDHRLHDRFVFERGAEKSDWQLKRLSP